MIAFIIATLAAAALLADARPAHAETSAWTEIYSKPANYFTDVAMFDDKAGLAASSGGLLRTSDGGHTWQEPQAIESMMYGHIGIAEATHAWVVALSGKIWHTADAGLTWQPQSSGIGLHLGAVAAISPTEAWATGRGSGFNDMPSAGNNDSVLLHTVDGGATWTHTDGLMGYNLFGEVNFTGQHGSLLVSRCDPEPPSTFFSCGLDKRALLVTSDGGANWTVAARLPDFVPERIVWFDARNGVAAGVVAIGNESTIRLYRTSDGGSTWQPAAGTVTGPLLNLQASAESSVWLTLNSCSATACHISLAHSADGGATWDQQAIPFESVGLTAQLAVTRDAVLLTGGPTGMARFDLAVQAWSTAAADTAPPFDAVVFASRDRGYAVGYHYFGVSDDGGATWSPRPTPVPFGGLLEADGDQVTAIVYDCGAPCPANAYRSRDGGSTWAPEQVDWATLPSLFTHERAVGSNRWRIASNGENSSIVERSRDGGATWSRELTVPGHGFDLQLRDGRLWLHVAIGVFGPGERTLIYRRDIDATGLSAPSVGSGNTPAHGAAAPALMLAAAGAAAILLGASLRRRAR